MEEARVSWNTLYQDKNGFECQITLRDQEEETLSERVEAVTGRILESGGTPVVRRYQNGNRQEGNGQGESSQAATESAPEKTYVDSKGMRRCNLKLTNGRRCNQPVTEREGRYGLFWSCPNYRDHAPPPAR